MVERLLVKYHHIFARHWLEIAINNDCSFRLTPKHDEPVYAQSVPSPTNLKDEMLVELALQQQYRITTILPISKYTSPNFAQRQPNRKLGILVDLRRTNHLIKPAYAAQHKHMAGKKYFCKLDCSQA